MEVDICAKWKEEDTFYTQDRLSQERGDKVRVDAVCMQAGWLAGWHVDKLFSRGRLAGREKTQKG